MTFPGLAPATAGGHAAPRDIAGRSLSVLLLEDSVADAVLLEEQLADDGFDCELTRVDTHAAFTEALVDCRYDIILSDYNVPGFDGGAALAAARLACPHIPFVFVTGALGDEKATELLKRGATDYVLKDGLDRLAPKVERALAEARAKTERSRAEQALRESERALSTLLGNLPGMAFRSQADDERRLTFASAGACDLTGYEPGELCAAQGPCWSSLVHADDVDALRAAIEGAFRNRRQLTSTYRIRTKGGIEKWVWERSVAILGSDGAIDHIEGFVADVTQQKQAEEAARTRAEFEQQLIGIVSHDLRNPLNTIVLGALTALRASNLDERTRGALGRIHAAGERAGRLIRDLLDFTQARLGGGIPLVPRPVELTAIVKHVVEDTAPAWPQRSIRVNAEDPGHGLWDPDRLTQVVTNLLGNALRYGAPDAPITLTTRAEGDEAMLEVHNFGPPIAPELRERLFLPMQRGHAGTDRERSVGLGLYIVDQIVRGHGGSIDVASSSQEGTTFRVKLPPSPR